MTTNYKSDIKLGEEYEDTQTGFRGIATATYFYQHGCERVNVEAYDEERREIRSIVFDAPRLKHVNTGKVAKTHRTGGPGLGNEDRAEVTAR